MKKKLKKITKATITHVSFVPKGANGQDFLIVKGENEPDMQFESPILKLDEEQHLVTGVVYEPNVVDSQGEFMEASAIEKAAHEFMSEYRNIDTKHNFVTNEGVSVVESYVAKADMVVDDKNIKKGTWLITTKVSDDDLWQGIKKGEYKGYSMGGTGIREDVEVDNGESEVTKEEKGFIKLVKEFFSGSQVTKEEEIQVVDFTMLAAIDSIENTRWALNDALRNIIRSNATNKKELLSAQIDSYKTYILNQFEQVGVEKMCNALSEPVQKTGKKISSVNGDKIKAAYESLGELISLMNDHKDGEGEEKMKKEDLEKVVKQAIEPLTARINALEKQEGSVTNNISDEIEKDAKLFASVVKEALEPLSERLEKVENARGISRQLQDNGEIEKSNEGYFANVQI